MSKKIGKILEFVLKWGVNRSVELLILASSSRVLSNSTNDSFAFSLLDKAVSEEEWILLATFTIIRLNGAFKLKVLTIILESLLLNMELGWSDNKAIGWNSGTSIDQNNISDDKVPNTHCLGGTFSSSNDSDCFFLDQFLKFNKSPIFYVVC